MSIVVFTIKRK